MVPFRIRRGEPYILITVGGPDATNVALDIAGKDGPRCELTVVTTELALSAIVGKLTELSVLSPKIAVGLVFKTWAELLVTIEKSVPVTDAVEKLVEADNSEAELSVCTEVVNCVSERLERELTEGPTCEMLRFEDGIVLDSTIWGVFTKLESGILPLSEPKGDEIGECLLGEPESETLSLSIKQGLWPMSRLVVTCLAGDQSRCSGSLRSGLKYFQDWSLNCQMVELQLELTQRSRPWSSQPPALTWLLNLYLSSMC